MDAHDDTDDKQKHNHQHVDSRTDGMRKLRFLNADHGTKDTTDGLDDLPQKAWAEQLTQTMMMRIPHGRDYCPEPVKRVTMYAKSSEQTQKAWINRQQHQTTPSNEILATLLQNVRIISPEQQP